MCLGRQPGRRTFDDDDATPQWKEESVCRRWWLYYRGWFTLRKPPLPSLCLGPSSPPATVLLQSNTPRAPRKDFPKRRDALSPPSPRRENKKARHTQHARNIGRHGDSYLKPVRTLPVGGRGLGFPQLWGGDKCRALGLQQILEASGGWVRGDAICLASVHTPDLAPPNWSGELGLGLESIGEPARMAVDTREGYHIQICFRLPPHPFVSHE